MLELACADCGRRQKRDRHPPKGYTLCVKCYFRREGKVATATVIDGKIVLDLKDAPDRVPPSTTDA